jgi:RNA polymerase sigma-70 factor (ECF subfamily)
MSDRDMTSSDALVRQAVGGDASALGRLLRKCRSWVVRAARRQAPRSLARKEDASDLAQKVLAEAVQAFPQFQGRDARTFRRWLGTIFGRVRRGLFRHWGQGRRDPKREEQLPAGSGGALTLAARAAPAAAQVALQEDVGWLNRALEQLEPADARLLRLRFFDDLPFEDIAARLDVKPATARKQVARLLDKLRDGIPLLQWLQRQAALPLQHQAVCLWYFQGCTQDAIAERLGIPRNAVTAWVQAAKANFPPRMGEES